MASIEQDGAVQSPTFVVTDPTDKSIKFSDDMGKPSSGASASSLTSSQKALDEEEAVEYDSDPEHAQDWSKTTPITETWAFRERRKSSKFAKGPQMPNPHAATPADSNRKGSVLSLFKTGNDFKSGSNVIHSGSDDHPEEWKAQKETRSMSNSSNDGTKRRGSILSMFTTGKDARGRHVVGSDWDDHKEETEIPVAAVPRTLTRVERLEAELREAREDEERAKAAKGGVITS